MNSYIQELAKQHLGLGSLITQEALVHLLKGMDKILSFGSWDHVSFGIGKDFEGNLTVVSIETTRWDAEGIIRGNCSCNPFTLEGFCIHVLALLNHQLKTSHHQISSVFESHPEFIALEKCLLSSEKLAVLSRQKVMGENTWKECLQAVSNEKQLPFKKQFISAFFNRKIWYGLDADYSLQSGYLVVRTYFSETLADGTQGALKPLYFTSLDLDEMPPEAKLPLQMMEAVALNDGIEKRHAFIVPPSFKETILDRLSQSKRFFFTRPWNMHPDQCILEWDPEPFTICLEIEELGSSIKANSALRQKETRLALSQMDLILPQGYCVFKNRLISIANPDSLNWLKQFNSNIPVIIAESERIPFLVKLSQMKALPALKFSETFGIEERDIQPQPIVQFLSPMRTQPRSHMVKVMFNYGLGHKLTPQDLRDTFFEIREKVVFRRNWTYEKEWISKLPSRWFKPDQEGDIFSLKISSRHVSAAVMDLIHTGWHVEVEGKPIKRGKMGSFKVHSGIDWFDLSLDVDFDGEKISLSKLLNRIKQNKDFIVLSDGSRGLLDPLWAEKLSSFLAFSKDNGDDHLRFHPSQALILDSFLQGMPGVDFDLKFNEFRIKIAQLSSPQAIDEPPGFQGSLRPYQKEGLGWLQFLQDLGVNGCLADDMGLGKTIQVLALLQSRKCDAKQPSLVIVPKSLVQNWVNEAAKFTPGLKVMVYEGQSRKALRVTFHQYDLVIMTYGIMRRDITNMINTNWDYVILDESQAIKNHLAQSTKAARLLKARFKLTLTGTPIENHVGELWSQFEFLNPGILGHSSMFKALSSKKKTLSPDEYETIAKGLRPFILRRTKNQVLKDLPLKTEQTLVCRMEKNQERIYHQLKRSLQLKITKKIEDDGLSASKIYILEALLRLRQVACHPGLVHLEPPESIKFQVLLEHLEEIIAEGHKALVFSQFTQLLGLLKREIFERGWAFEYLDGKSRRREESIRRFQEEKNVPLFLISLKAGGLGLNLTAADYVYILDPWWNPAVENQAIDRTHRIGQTKSVFAYRLIVKDTIEEKILALQKQKNDLAEALISENNSVLSQITKEDLELLFK